MKKLCTTLLSLLLLIVLTTALFACSDPQEPPAPSVSEEQLALTAANAAIKEGASDTEIASAILSLLKASGLEEPEIRAVLLALPERGEALSDAYLDLLSHDFTTDHADSYRAALQVVSSATSPELAGSVFFTAKSQTESNLPYTLEDCRKLASLLLSQDAAFGGDALENLLKGNYSGVNERLASTLLLSLSASLGKAIGISDSAKEYLYSLAVRGIEQTFYDETTGEADQSLQKTKRTLTSLAATLRDRYDVTLTYLVKYLSASDARLLLGLPYEKKQATVYYGYDYETWKMTMITKEEYEAKAGDYDEYLTKTSTVKGFTVNGEFLSISEEDAALADRVYRLFVGYRAYRALSDKEKTAFREAIAAYLTVLSKEQDTVAALLDKPLIDPTDEPAATADELLSALSALSDFDATDGISDSERGAASNAVATFERYLHGFLPSIY